MSDETMLARYHQLQELKKRVDEELFAIERGLCVAGVLSVHGRPRNAPTHTVSQAKAAHAAWQRGERDEWTLLGERQYQREKKRTARAEAQMQRAWQNGDVA